MGDFTKSEAERPLSSRGRGGQRRGRGWGSGAGARERADDLDDDTTKNQMHGHWLFSIRIIGFPGRRSSEPPRPSRYSFSLSFSLFLRSLLPLSLCRRRRHRHRRRRHCHRHLLRRASISSLAPFGNGRRREGPKKLRKKNPISLPW